MQNRTELRQLINEVMNGLTPLATERKNIFVNDINPDVKVYADENILALVFGKLLKTTINHTKNDCIRISAKKYSDIVLLNITETGHYSYAGVADSLETIQPMAGKLGGCITVSSYSVNGTNVALSFFNGVKAA